MLIQILCTQSYKELHHALAEAEADAVEIRFDAMPIAEIEKYINQPIATQKIITATIRRGADGGLFTADEPTRLALIEKLCRTDVAYIDMETDIDDGFVKKIMRQSQAKVVRSYHSQQSPPQDIAQFIAEQKTYPGDIHKIIFTAHTVIDALRLAAFRKTCVDKSLILHCMGEHGLLSRIVGAMYGNAFTYVSSTLRNETVACPTMHEAKSLYRLAQVNQETKIFVLLGEPVKHSQGHYWHNAFFQRANLNAIYVKLKCTTEELEDFFTLAASLPIYGASITMPLKEAILPYCHSLDASAAHAANTLYFSARGIFATNTDGVGAATAITNVATVANTIILILGTGATARAIARSLEDHNPQEILFVSRSEKIRIDNKACISYADLASIKHADIIISTLPREITLTEVAKKQLLTLLAQAKLSMDVNYNNISALPFTIDGEAMFDAQAQAQQDYWHCMANDVVDN